MNPYRGEVALELDGKPHVLRFTWSALVQLRADFGSDFDTRLSAAMLDLDLEAIAKALAIGLRHAHPDITPARVMDGSPTITAATDALQTALRLAFHGPGEVVAKASQNPLRAAASRLKRITSKMRTLLGWPAG